MTTSLNYKQNNPSSGFGGCLLWFAFFLLPCIYGCKTSHEITRTVFISDSSAAHVRDSATAVITDLKQKHVLDIEAVKNTGVTFQPACDTIIFPPDFNKDSAISIINSLRNKVTINANGSIEAQGKLQGAYSNLQSKQHELSEKDSIIQRLTLQHEADSSSRHSEVANTHEVDKSKPGGIFGSLYWILIIVAFIAGGIIGWTGERKYRGTDILK